MLIACSSSASWSSFFGKKKKKLPQEFIIFVSWANHFNLYKRCCCLRHGVCQVARGTSSNHLWAPSCSTGAFVRERPPALCRQLLSTLWRGNEPQKHGCQNRRIPSCLRHVEDSGWTMLSMDRWIQAIWAHQGTPAQCPFIVINDSLFVLFKLSSVS